jgi:3-methylfumaryl-CoA hydratase
MNSGFAQTLSMNKSDLEFLQQWVGRTESARTLISANPVAGLAATLDRTQVPTDGEALPPLWHWLYFTPLARQSELGADGHPATGGFLPPIPLPRRMWAGGRLKFALPVIIGEEVSKTTAIQSITHKAGKQGPLIFVTLRHELSGPRGLAIIEEQDLVYRPTASSVSPVRATPSASPPPEIGHAWSSEVVPSPALLFRYSALTFNAHRIHYDLAYAQEEEGYPQLVVHGPLIATLIADRLLANVQGQLSEFGFRALSPLFVDAPFKLCGNEVDTAGHCSAWAESRDGILSMSTTAIVRPFA